jgi:hypothetical protein
MCFGETDAYQTSVDGIEETLMTRFCTRLFRTAVTGTALILLAAGPVPAQDQPPANSAPSGGWRRVGDPPPAPAAPQTQAQNRTFEQGQDPEPVDHSEQYGQAQSQDPQPPYQQPPQAPLPAAQAPANRPPVQQQYNRPAYGVPPQLTLQPGTYVTVRINQALSTDHNQPGDVFSGTLMQPVVVDGIVVAQRGQTVYGRVAEVQKQHSDRPSRLGLELTGLTLADGNQASIHSQLVARQGGSTPGGIQAGTVATTTAVGAGIGGAVGWGTGAAIGAGAGAAAGIIGVLLTRNHPTVIYPETALTFNITSALAISTARSPHAFRYVGPEDYSGPNQELALRPRPPACAGYGCAPPPAYYGYGPGYYGPGYYPYFWGPSVGFVFGSGPGYYWGRGYYRRWR